MKEQIKEALAVKGDALEARESGRREDLTKALSLINTAIDLLKELWEQKGESINRAGSDASPDERKLVEALAETYGIKGGVLRSLGEFEQAVQAYGEGLFFEQHKALKVDNSYNLVQRLTNRVLAAPREAGDPTMWQELEAARAELQRQIAVSRGGDPWAAADMITVQLLLAPQDPSSSAQRLQEAYSKFKGLKPKPRVYESMLRALKDLGDSLGNVSEEERSENLKLILGQLDVLTERLNDGFEEAKAG